MPWLFGARVGAELDRSDSPAMTADRLDRRISSELSGQDEGEFMRDKADITGPRGNLRSRLPVCVQRNFRVEAGARSGNRLYSICDLGELGLVNAGNFLRRHVQMRFQDRRAGRKHFQGDGGRCRNGFRFETHFLLSSDEKAMEKQLACAAAMSSSGLPGTIALLERAAGGRENEYWRSLRAAPFCGGDATLPEPGRRPECIDALGFIKIMFLMMAGGGLR